MPKNKTHSGAKPSTLTRRLNNEVVLSPADAKRAKKLLGQ